MGLGIEIGDLDWALGLGIGNRDSALGLGIRIELGIMIRDLGLESGIGDWGLRIGDWDV